MFLAVGIAVEPPAGDAYDISERGLGLVRTLAFILGAAGPVLFRNREYFEKEFLAGRDSERVVSALVVWMGQS